MGLGRLNNDSEMQVAQALFQSGQPDIRFVSERPGEQIYCLN